MAVADRYLLLTCLFCHCEGALAPVAIFRGNAWMRAAVLLRCPTNVLGFQKPSSLVDRGHSLRSLLPPLAALPSPPRIDLHFCPLGRNDCSHQCLHWWQQVSTGHLHLDGFDSVQDQKKRDALHPSSFGAADRNRTGTDFTPRDFKSLVSTYSTTAAYILCA